MYAHIYRVHIYDSPVKFASSFLSELHREFTRDARKDEHLAYWKEVSCWRKL